MPHRTIDFSHIVILLITAGLLWSCKTTNAPQNYLPHPKDMATHGFGGWTDIYLKNPDDIETEVDSLPPFMQSKLFNPDQPLSGEMIAIEKDSLYVHSAQGLRVLPKNVIDNVDLQGYKSGFSLYTGTTLFGILSTITHGFYLILSTPLWLISGVIFGGSQAHVPILEYPDRESWGELRRFARFPQGLPEDMSRNQLKSQLNPRQLK